MPVSDVSANPAVQGGDKRAIRKTYKLRLRDGHSAKLRRQARAVIGIWKLLQRDAAEGGQLSTCVNASKIARSRFTKSVLDAGWADFKRMLSEKAMTHGGSTLEVCQRHTSKSCLECGSRTASLPRSIAGLRKRMIACDDCGAVPDRGVNAARNILRIGQDALAGGAHV